MGTLIDASVLIAAERSRLASWDLDATDEVGIAAITASELLHGVLRASRTHRPQREAFVESILSTVRVYPFGVIEARLYARLWVDATAKGTSPGVHDLLVAATALALGWRVATVNRRHFDRIPGPSVIGPGA
ncbi:MAG: PIN domain-containing protein [Candidatus Dormibacteraeota bacterium]|nr:PIN domain-containing protein [Candidatus Dormibacteraeota bacterium]